MKALLINAHPEPTSLCHGLVDIAKQELEAAGHEVMISDLYAMNFNPVLGPHDVTERLNPEKFNAFAEQGNAAEKDLFAADIQGEIDKLKAADFIMFQYPMWWFGMPAIMKGWVDRVLAYGVAYGLGQWWDQGMLSGKKAMLSIVTGTPKSGYEPDGRNGDIERILWSQQAGILAICGFDVLPAHIMYGPMWVPDEVREGMIEAFRERIKTIDTTEPVFFHKLDEFGEDMRLKPEVTPNTPGQWR